jgi:hypothetical protein
MNLRHKHGTPLLINLGVVGSTARRIMRRTGKAILWLVAALLVLAVVGAIYQVIATARAHPPPGEMVDVGTTGYTFTTWARAARPWS